MGANYAHNASFAFVAKLWVFIFWCCFYSHKRTGNVQTAEQGARNFGGRNIAKLAISARGDKSTLRTFLSRFRMLFCKTYCFPTACNYVEVNRSANASGTHIASGTIYHTIVYIHLLLDRSSLSLSRACAFVADPKFLKSTFKSWKLFL